MRIFYNLVLFILAFLSVAQAQQLTLSGKVLKENGDAVPNASVFLVTEPSRGIIKSAVTDENGVYKFFGFPKGSFRIQVTAVGFAAGESAPFTLDDTSFVVDDIILLDKTKEIETVEVKGQLPMIQNSKGKLVMNVENSSVAAGNNALEVLKRAPGVYVDKDDNITLMGNSGVNVTIDGRQTYMTGEQLATLLKSMSGDQIKSIELSTVRTAKDDAEGGGGLINITLKKNRLEGMNGNVTLSAGYGKKFRGNGGFNLNYRKNGTAFFSNYSYTDNKRLENIKILRVIPGGNSQTTFDQMADAMDRMKTHSYKFGVEQRTSKRNVLVAQFTGSNNNNDENNISDTKMGEHFGVVDSLLDSYNIAGDKFNRYSFNVNNEFTIDSTGKKLALDVDYSIFNRDGLSNYEYATKLNDMQLLRPIEYEQAITGKKINIFATKLDYTQPLWKGALEAGVKYSNVDTKNDISFLLSNDKAGNWIVDNGRTNSFNYTEEIMAGYLDFARDIKKWGFKIGLRGEYTISNGYSPTLDEAVKKNYFDLFPSASVSYSLNENHNFSLSYSRKVTRPNYNDLNPFETYIDKRTYIKGNSFLRPSYKDGFTLVYTLFKRFNVAVGFDYTNDAIVESIGQDSVLKTTWVLKENVGRQSTGYVNLTVPLRIGKVWTMYNNLTGIHLYFKGPVSGYYVDQGAFFVQGNSTNTFKLNSQLSAEVLVRGNTRFIFNMYEIQPRIATDLGLTYNFKDKVSSLKFGFTDVFHTDHNNVFTHFKEFDSKIYQYHDSQTFRLTFTRKFGNLKQSFRRIDNNSEEKERAM